MTTTYLNAPIEIARRAQSDFAYAVNRATEGDLLSPRYAVDSGMALIGHAVDIARREPKPTALTIRQTEWDRRAAGINGRFDALDDYYSDSISWNARGQSGSRGDYERAAALSQLGPRPR